MEMTNIPNFCECEQDGWCERYQRDQIGRFREICRGVNCDLGTAAAFRDQWLRETTVSKSKSDILQHTTNSIPLLLKTDQAPGDAVAMTAAIYSLHKAHPGKYLTWVESPYPEVFEYNPDVRSNEYPRPDALPIQMHYPAIHDSNIRGIHFMQAYCEFLGFALGIHVPLLTNRPHLYRLSSPTEPKHQIGDYWVICSGGKKDLTNKMWGHNRYQEVVVRCADIEFVQVGDSISNHPRLGYTDDMVGKTNLRQLFDLVWNSRGVVCGVSLLMHIAAALEKPCIVIAGGREPVAWNSYSKQHYLHTVGMLPCSNPQGNIGGACWRSRTVSLNDGTALDKDLCLRPIGNTPECMTMISPERVVELILQYDKQYECKT